MTCRELIGVIDEYVEGAMPPEDRTEFEAHLRACAPCRAYLATYRATRSLTRDAGQIQMPEEVQDRFRNFLAWRLTRKL